MTRTALAVPATLACALAATPALAHHPLAGAPMETFTHGVLSGVGHPILGFDHLFFVLAVGVLALFTGRALSAPLAYAAGMLGGVALILGGIALPMVEVVIAASLVITGALIMRGRAVAAAPAMILFAALGAFHGWAFGESLAGVEAAAATAVITGYLIGLAAIQWAIAVGFGMVLARVWNARTAEAIPARLTGGVIAGVGAFLVLEAAEGAAFAALGLG